MPTIIQTGDTLNAGRIIINGFLTGSSLIWSSGTGSNSVLLNNSTGNLASGLYSFAAGKSCSGTGAYSVVLHGLTNRVNGIRSTVVNGQSNTVLSNTSVISSGKLNKCLVSGSYACISGGYQNYTNGVSSFVGNGISNRGYANQSFIGNGSGNSALTNSFATVVNGFSNKATGSYSAIVNGSSNVATGTKSFIGNGASNTVSGSFAAVIAGKSNTISGSYSIALAGQDHVIGASYTHTVTMGKGASVVKSYQFIIAKSATNTIRLDGVTGIGIFNGGTAGSGADFAEMFEWKYKQNSEKNHNGYFVSLYGNKIQKGNKNILGVTSTKPSVISDIADSHWKNAFVTDDWGNEIMETYKVFHLDGGEKIYENSKGILYKKIPSLKNKTGVISTRNVLTISSIATKTEFENHPIINDDYNPDVKYVSRLDRQHEWGVVGILGKLLVRTAEEITGQTVQANEKGFAINPIYTPLSSAKTYPLLEQIKPYPHGGYGIVKVLIK